jgi:hypothetical protein
VGEHGPQAPHAIGDTRPSIYLDLESSADRAKLADPQEYLAGHVRQRGLAHLARPEQRHRRRRIEGFDQALTNFALDHPCIYGA